MGLGGILRHASALVVHPPEVALRAGVALLGGAAVPRDRFGGILRHADADDIHAAEDELRLGVARLGAGAEVGEGLCGWAVFILCLNTGREGGDHEGDTHNEATHCVYSKALNRHLRVISVGLAIAVLLLIVVVFRIVSVEPPRPIVVRVDEVGRAEAVAYNVMEAQANPLDPTTKYFLNRFIYDYYSRRRATVAQNWSRSLRFLSTPLANASFRTESQNVALLAAGVARGELQVARVILRIQPNPQQPHSATADFDIVRMEMENEVGRERWTLSMQFQFLQQIPTELIVFNPMGIVITYLQGDRAIVTGDQ